MLLFVCVLLISSLQHRGYTVLPTWYNGASSPRGVYSSIKVQDIDPVTSKLLQDDLSKFWDCDVAASPCRYFNPYRFFQEEGKEFQNDYNKLGGSNNNLPAMTALSWSPTSSATVQHVVPHTLSFIHVHKSAGTTVKTLLAQAKHKLENKGNVKLNTYKYSFGGGSKVQKERNQQKRHAHIENMAAKSPAKAIVFSVIRDPLERFVSAVQQVMHYNEEFREKCLKWTARATLKCAIQYTRESNYLRDVHLIPMMLHFRLWDQYPELQIAVIHLQDIHVLAEYFRVSTTTERSINITTTMPHGRDRSQVMYATSSVLANMSVKRDCTPAMIKELCQVYAIDVVFLKSIGWETPHCQV